MSWKRWTLLVPAAALAAFAALSSAAAGARKPANGPIVFQAFVGTARPAPTELFTINPDGTGLRQITHIPGNDESIAERPNWAPDGSKIVFDSDSQPTPDHIVSVYTVKPDGSDLTQVAIPVGPLVGSPAYSPSGDRIAFDFDSSTVDPHTGGIDIALADGSSPQRVTIRQQTIADVDTTSAWSPNGQWLAFDRIRKEGVSAIFKVRLDGTGLKRLTRWSLNAAGPRWSPDGSKILFYSHDEEVAGAHANLYTVRPNGRHLVQLTHYKFGLIQARSPDWSPDGKWIVWHRTPLDPNGPGKNQLFIMRANGTGARQLTHLPAGSNPGHAKWGTLG